MYVDLRTAIINYLTDPVPASINKPTKFNDECGGLKRTRRRRKAKNDVMYVTWFNCHRRKKEKECAENEKQGSSRADVQT